MASRRQRPGPHPAPHSAVPTPPPPEERGTRERLLAAGLTLALRDGLKAMSVRAVAAEAGVNLGSFVYHFGTREAFVFELVEGWYAPLMDSLQLSAQGPDALRDVLRQLARWVSTNARFLALLVRDASAGEVGVQRFLAGMDQRHIALLLRLIAQGQQAGRLKAGDPVLQLMFLVGSLVLPILLVQGLQGLGPPAFVGRLAALAGDDAAIDTRLDYALAGLAAQGN